MSSSMSSRRRAAEKGLQISNPDKVLYPAATFTKADVLSYYERVAPFLLPHFRNRPLTLKRYPNGVFGEAFYEKDAPGFTPRWVKTFPVPRREGGADINYILINDVETLAWAANMAVLELHPFLHRVPYIDRPTHIVFDLDPGEGTAKTAEPHPALSRRSARSGSNSASRICSKAVYNGQLTRYG